MPYIDNKRFVIFLLFFEAGIWLTFQMGWNGSSR